MSPVSPNVTNSSGIMTSIVNARFAAIEQGIEDIGQTYNQVAEGCTELETRVERLEQSASNTESTNIENIESRFNAIEHEVKTLDKTIQDFANEIRNPGFGDVDEVLESVLLRLQKLEKAPIRQQPSTTATMSTTHLAQTLYDRLQNGDVISNGQLVKNLHQSLSGSTITQPKRALVTPTSDVEPNEQQQPRRAISRKIPTTFNQPSAEDADRVESRRNQTSAAREARAKKRKRQSTAENELPPAKSRSTRKAGSKSDPSAIDKGVNIEGKEDEPRRSSRAPKPTQLAAGTMSWAEAKALKKR